MTRAVIDGWHDALTPALAAESAGWLNAELKKRGLFFGDRALCNVLRPRFLSPAQNREMRSRIAVLLKTFDKALAAALEQPAILAQFHLEDWERTLVLEDPHTDPSPVSRLDAFYSPDDGRLRFTEYNAETPAGAGYNDALTELFLALPVMRSFRRRFTLEPLPALHNVLHSLVSAYQRFSGGRTKPTIGILDWKEVPTYSEFIIYRNYFRSMGFECVIGDPREVDYRNGGLYAEGVKIDLIYKRVLINELIADGGLDHPMVRAVRDGAACMANPFRCKVLHKKASLAVLSDERNAGLFSPAERAVIAEHVPWTRVVAERRTERDGRTIDLMPFVMDHKEDLVLKPNDDYGGAGVVLGWEVDQTTWSAAVAKALAQPHIVQQRIGLPSELFPSLVGDDVVYADRIVDTAPFCFDGAFVEGCLTRVSTATLVNVTAGGGSTVPTFVAAPRDS
ncbi:MAG: hypothetical protein ACKVZ0_02505 [Gemmatimonadales bacterium]